MKSEYKKRIEEQVYKKYKDYLLKEGFRGTEINADRLRRKDVLDVHTCCITDELINLTIKETLKEVFEEIDKLKKKGKEMLQESYYEEIFICLEELKSRLKEKKWLQYILKHQQT